MRRLGFFFAASFCACGDPLAAGDFRGEPLFVVEGLVMDYESAQADREQLTASVYWSITGETNARGADLIEEPYVSVAVNFLNVFRINLFHPPPDPRLYDNDRGYAVGLILVEQDGELSGGADLNALIYAPYDIPPDRSPSKTAIPAGYSLVNLPLPCGLGESRIPLVHGDQDCGVPLGAECSSDTECGERGVCLDDVDYFGESFPGGYCAVPNTPQGCAPKDGVLGPELVIGPDQYVPSPFWFAACESDHECRDGYRCDFAMGACWPEWPAAIVIAPEFEMAPFCF